VSVLKTITVDIKCEALLLATVMRDDLFCIGFDPNPAPSCFP
jgi:hypothetical protein